MAPGRCLLFLDVDGTLIPFANRPGDRPLTPMGPDHGNPLLHRLDPDDGDRRCPS